MLLRLAKWREMKYPITSGLIKRMNSKPGEKLYLSNSMINLRKGGEERALVLNIESQVNIIPHIISVVINTSALDICFAKNVHQDVIL